MSLARFRAEREALLARDAPLGIVIEPGADWSDIVADLPRFAVVAADLPKFADGRAFSIGRLLRDRDGFTGELRAVGAFFLDQMPFLKRVGFDSFETDDPLVLRALKRGAGRRWPNICSPSPKMANCPPASAHGRAGRLRRRLNRRRSGRSPPSSCGLSSTREHAMQASASSPTQREVRPMSDLVVIVYPSLEKAEEVRQQLLKLQKEYLITLDDAVIAVKTEDGKIKLHQMVNTTATGAISGGFWGLLVGMLFLMPVVGVGDRCRLGRPRRPARRFRHQRQVHEGI